MTALLVKTLDNLIEIFFFFTYSLISLELSLICLSSWSTGSVDLH